eukprot:TRINITY_DN297_c0_g1_i1.p1 TRINITY_DN297_c0_g1~~TRINITY_DN297_c0_g1_i1.p1  ORF type:complete len:311 (+),score=42.82 TRINITY_DN297_c0_g1_i1:1351-2283(+)
MSHQTVSYWKRKWSDQYFHPEPWGGTRESRFTLDQETSLLVEEFIYDAVTMLQSEIGITINDLVVLINGMLGVTVSSFWVKQTFYRWGWTWKKPQMVHKAKFSRRNEIKYNNHLNWMLEVDITRLKFLDESHFDYRRLGRQRGIGPRGQRVHCCNTNRLGQTFSLTLITSLVHDPPYYFEIREQSNTQWDFFSFVTDSILEYFLVPGDFLVVDNATVHLGRDMIGELLPRLDALDIRMVTLPTYSPELNPCELVFNVVKGYCRGNASELTLERSVRESFRYITPQKMRGFYDKCCDPYQNEYARKGSFSV